MMGTDREGNEYGPLTGSSEAPRGRNSSRRIEMIGKRTVAEIQDTLYRELHEQTIPLWRNDGVDWQYGGYAPAAPVNPEDAAGWPYMDEKGHIVSTNKKLYHQGRILWLYSYLYNRIEPDVLFLQAAENGYRFLDNHCRDDRYTWFTEVSRQGKPVTKFHTIIACIYMTLGLAEYYRATGHTVVRDKATRSAYRIAELLYAPHYLAQGHSPFYPITDSHREPGTKRLGYWIHYLNALTTLLRYTEDPGLEKIARNCVRNILTHHYRPDIELPYEFLQWDFSVYPNDYLADDYLRAVDGFHGIEAAWMTMDEALRVGSREMFLEAVHMGRRLIEKTYLERDGKQGLVRFYWPDEDDPFARSEILGPYVMKELFVFLLLTIEHTGEQWAMDWFDKAFSYAYETPIRFPYFDTLHNPRGLFFGLTILERILAREGGVSHFLSQE
jgi:N-acylglucosamine 2-epimerase